MVGVNELENLKESLRESFGKIKEDFNSIDKDMKEKDKKFDLIKKELKELNNKLIEENDNLNKKLLSLAKNSSKPEIDQEEIVNKVVEIALQKINGKTSKLKDEFVKKFERKRKDLIKQKIIELANNQQLTIPEIKDILVDKEGYCSKATFYRYIEKLQNTKEIDFVELNERKVVINKK